MLREAPTIFDSLAAIAELHDAEIVFHLAEGRVHLTTNELVGRALECAGRLIELDVGRGDAVGILGRNRPEWFVWAYAAWAIGAVVVPLPFPVRVTDRPSLAMRLRRMSTLTGCRVVLADPELGPLLDDAVPWEVPVGGQRADPLPVPPEAPAVYQFTSGTTAFPKAAIISHGAALASVRTLASIRGFDPEGDSQLVWVPFFHDMGLFGVVVRATLHGIPNHVLPTEDFVREPGGWLRLMSRTNTTLTQAPPSGWLAALRRVDHTEDIDLAAVRMATMSAESLDPAVIDRVAREAGRFGLPREALVPTYGLSEATNGVTSTPVGRGPRVDSIDRERLAEGTAEPAERPRARSVVSCGAPIPGVEVAIPGPDGHVQDRRVGEILVRGPILMDGYLASDEDPFVDGWLRTGDLGYLADGELYVTGRSKDVIIAYGRNYLPEDLEWAAGRVDGVRPGRVVAFSRPGGRDDEAVLLVEPRDPDTDLEALARRVKREVARTEGLPPAEVVVLPPATIEKTTSGKIRRGAMRESYTRGELPTSTPLS